MSDTTRAVLLGVFVLAAAVWVGGLVAIVVVARVASRTLSAGQRVAFFRGLGRSYGVVGVVALAVALATGATLLSGHPWDGARYTTVVVAAALVATTAVGIVQARRMSRLRRRALDHPDETALAEQVRRGARSAAVLRGGIALFTLVLVALGSVLAS
ncbi:MAG TPA: hypothetical protein VIR27_10725 [Mycobacteriales bacterium]|jgi:hypothetical protein